VFTAEDSVVIKFLHQNKGCYAKFLMQAETIYTELWLILSLMNVKKIRRFLFSIKEDAHKRKLVLFFCLTVYVGKRQMLTAGLV